MVGIRSAFAGSRVLVTGATGFLGTALVAKMLRSLPDVGRVLLLVRSKPGAPAAERVERRVIGFNAFDDLRARDDWPALAAKVEALDGDLRAERCGLSDDDLAKLSGVDYVIHAAATVEFDSSIDESFETNLAGPLRLVDALEAAGAKPRRYVHVSTAYVAGLTKGAVHEVPWTDVPGRPRLDWRAELAVARQARPGAEAQSRMPERLSTFLKEAKRHVGPAGAAAVATKAEQLRRDWVNDRLVELGRSRALSLGWPDAYGFTKALAESAMLERAEQSGLPLVIVRPSIIESALREPFPGWIRGFRMAEPVILAYGRGALSQFPGKPDTVIDVVPVDLVVNALLAAAASEPKPDVLHVSTGHRRPIRYRELVQLVHEFFQRDPYFDENRQPILPEMWTFPGRAKVESRLRFAKRTLRTSLRVLERLPRNRVADVAERIENRLNDLDQTVKYAELYGAYAEVETIFEDDKTAALFESLPPDERDEFRFDPRDIEWSSYLKDVHLPEVTRRRGTVRRGSREAPKVRVKPASAGAVLAAFDLEGTVSGTNVVDTYLYIRLAASPRSEWPRRVVDLARRVPQMLSDDRRDRGEFLRKFYRRYAGASVEDIAGFARDAFDAFILPRCFPEAIRRIRDHRAAGHQIVFITGALDFTIAPFGPLADHVAAARLSIKDGRYTGELVEVPLAGDARATYLRVLASRTGADLRNSYAYGDSISDLPMLETVGNPVAVNPDSRLARIARHRRWAIERWETESNAPRFTVPEGITS